MGKNASNMEEKVKKGTRILGRRERFRNERNEKLRNQIKKNATETSTTRLDQKDQRTDESVTRPGNTTFRY